MRIKFTLKVTLTKKPKKKSLSSGRFFSQKKCKKSHWPKFSIKRKRNRDFQNLR